MCCAQMCAIMFCGSFFFFKQKTAYEMRISDWSSDVCSTDLSIAQGAATSVWAAAVAEADAIGGRYCEDCQVGEIDDRDGIRPGVRPYALDPDSAKALWAKSEDLVGERFR